MKTINKLSKITDVITVTFGYIAAAALLFNVVIIILNVVFRAFGSAIIGTEEYISMGEVVLIFLALGYTQYNRGLVHVCFFMKRIPGAGSVVAWALHQWMGVVVIIMLLVETCKQIPMVRQVTTALLIPNKPFYVVVAVGCAVYLVAQLFEAIKATAAIFNKEVREEVVKNLPA